MASIGVPEYSHNSVPTQDADFTADEQFTIVQPQTKPKYELKDLIASCELAEQLTEEDRVWLDTTPAGKEF